MRTATKMTTISRSLTGLIHAPNAATSNATLVQEYKDTADEVSGAAKALLVALLKHRRSTLRLAMRIEQIQLGKAPALKALHQGVAEHINFQVTDLLRTLINHMVAYVCSTSHDMAEITRDRASRKAIKIFSEVKEIKELS